MTLFDVGANIGSYTKQLLQAFPSATIHSFEPSKITYERLKSNIQNERAVLNNIGMSNSVGKTTLFSDVDGSGLASVHKRNLKHFNIEMNKTEAISVTTIDDYCKKMEISMIDLLKVDIEGHELQVFEGAKKMLQDKKIRNIQFEFGGCNIDSRTFFQDFWYLLNQNYRIFRICKNGFFEIENYSESKEIFIYSNFFAVLKQ